MEKILIYGAGAVGQFIGGLLSQLQKYDVKMVGSQDHYYALKSRGLKIRRKRGTEHLRVDNFLPTLDRIPRDEKFDWIFLTVKGYNINKAMKDLSFLINDKVRFLLFQMGIGSHEHVLKVIPKERIFLASMTANVAIIEPGIVVQTNKDGALCIAPLVLRQDLNDIMSIFSRPALDILSFEDWKPMKWSALLYEMLLNGIGALVDYTPDKIMTRPDLFEMEINALMEGKKVADAIGVKISNLPAYPISKLLMFTKFPGFIRYPLFKGAILQKDSAKVPTLKNDMEKAKKGSEVGFINGAVARWGKERRIRTPMNDFITDELVKVVTGKKLWDVYRKKPEELTETYHFYKLNYVR